MKLSLIEIFSIIIIHWFADFICQDEQWALGKSKNWKDLLSHTFTYSIIWLCYFNIINAYNTFPVVTFPVFAFKFACITFIFHTTTDYFTSRIVSRKFTNKEYGSSIPNLGAFTVIGFDQVLHYIQLFLTYNLLK